MNKKVIIIGAVILLSVSITILMVSKYREYKCEKIIKETTLKSMLVKAFANSMEAKIKKDECFMIVSETEHLKNILEQTRSAYEETCERFDKYKSYTDVQRVRAKLEDGFDASVTTTPIKEFEMQEIKLKAIESFCDNRLEIRNRVLHNEMTLKAILKKPITSSGIELPNDLTKVGKYAPDLLKTIPKDTKENKDKIASLEDANLNNQMGVKLFDHKAVVERINKVAKSEQVKNRAEILWNSAKQAYSSVKKSNDAIHWYDPSADDGKYDASAYSSLLGNQSTALNFFNGGEQYLTQLVNYRSEVETQYVKYISSNSYDDTSFRHSKTVDEPAVRYDKEGKAHHYTKSKTVWFSTDGRIFYYTVTTLTLSSRNDQKIKVGEKDSYYISNSFGNWRSWDYSATQRENYLCEYKPYGYDNASRQEGGIYNPAVHSLCQPVP